MSESAQDIVSEAKNARTALTDLDHELQEERDEIFINAILEGRQMTQEEKDRRKELRKDQVEVQDAFRELAFVTLARLDSSEEVTDLKKRMKEVNDELNDDLNRLKDIRRYAQTAAKVTDTLAKVATKLTAFVI